MKNILKILRERIVTCISIVSLIIGIIATIIFALNLKIFLIVSILVILLSIFILFAIFITRALENDTVDPYYYIDNCSYHPESEIEMIGVKTIILLIAITIITIFLMILVLVV